MMIDDFYQLCSDTRQSRINDRSAFQHRLPDQKLSLQPNEVIYHGLRCEHCCNQFYLPLSDHYAY